MLTRLTFGTLALCFMTACVSLAQAAPAAEPASAPEGANPAVVPVRVLPLPKFQIYYAILAHSNGKVYLGGCYGTARLYEVDPANGAVEPVK